VKEDPALIDARLVDGACLGDLVLEGAGHGR
jgi:hypothetical protein